MDTTNGLRRNVTYARPRARSPRAGGAFFDLRFPVFARWRHALRPFPVERRGGDALVAFLPRDDAGLLAVWVRRIGRPLAGAWPPPCPGQPDSGVSVGTGTRACIALSSRGSLKPRWREAHDLAARGRGLQGGVRGEHHYLGLPLAECWRSGRAYAPNGAADAIRPLGCWWPRRRGAHVRAWVYWT